MSFSDDMREEEGRFNRRQLVIWSIAFFACCAFITGALWWAGSAFRYGAERVQNKTIASYEVSGTVTDAVTKKSIPWATVATDFQFGGKYFEATAEADGKYTLLTLAEPHRLIFRANGYREASVNVGKQWFSWLPKGAEHRDIALSPQ